MEWNFFLSIFDVKLSTNERNFCNGFEDSGENLSRFRGGTTRTFFVYFANFDGCSGCFGRNIFFLCWPSLHGKSLFLPPLWHTTWTFAFRPSKQKISLSIGCHRWNYGGESRRGKSRDVKIFTDLFFEGSSGAVCVRNTEILEILDKINSIMTIMTNSNWLGFHFSPPRYPNFDSVCLHMLTFVYIL